MSAPLCVDLFCGLGGWTEGFLAEGYDVVGFDVEQHVYGDERYPGMLALQDVLTLHGSQFRDAAVIVASPPCQEFSYMAMPWTRAKEKAERLRAGSAEDRAKLTALFDSCFRIQREACEASGRYIPLVVENVKGAQRWVGRAQWHYGSFYLWGDVPALMPMATKAVKVPGMNWSGSDKPGCKAVAFNDTRHAGQKNGGGSWFAIGSPGQKVVNQNPVHDGVKVGDRNAHRATGGAMHSARFTNADEQPTRGDGSKQGGSWFHDSSPGTLRSKSGGSTARKAASARIAKIPFTLAQHIARTYLPYRELATA